MPSSAGDGAAPPRRTSTHVVLADQAYSSLFSQLMTGVRKPGQRLNIERLSREMDLSPTPLREALARLEHTGLVRREALRGYEVAPLLSGPQIQQLMATRELLEPTFAAEATRRSTPEFLAELDSTIQDMERAGNDESGGMRAPDGAGQPDLPTMSGQPAIADALRLCWLADETFHARISHQAGNPFGERAYQSLGGQLQRFRLIGNAGVWHAHRAALEHRAIYAAIRIGDADAAAACMRAHLHGALRRSLADERTADGRTPENAAPSGPSW